MKSTLKKDDATHYVSEADMINFIDQNSDMDWNQICDFVRKKGITDDETGSTMWCKSNILNIKNSPYYNEEQIKWVGNFFEAHPWINKMMVVFND